MARRLQFALIFAVLCAAIIRPEAPSTAFAQAGGCFLDINGQDIRDFGESRHALAIRGDRPVEVGVISLNARSTISDVTVRAEIGPFEKTYNVNMGETRPDHDWNGTVDLNSQIQRGVGLQRLLVATGAGCQGIAWVKLEGRSPFTTFFGLTAIILVFAGIAIAVWGVRRAAAGSHGISIAIVGAVATGLGLAVLAQQTGRTPLLNNWILLWMALPVSVATLSSIGLSRRYAAEHPYDDDDEDDDYDASDAHFGASPPARDDSEPRQP